MNMEKSGSYGKRVGKHSLITEKFSLPVSKYAITLKCSNLYPRAFLFAA